MTVHEIIAAWAAARAAGGARFYEEFERLTGFSEVNVRAHFAAWCRLRHETAEEIAAENGVTIREGGFQAYLADLTRTQRAMPRMCAVVDCGYEEDEDPNPRQDKPWPEAEDCPGCDQSVSGPHRFGCTVHGARQLTVPVTQGPDGKFRVT